MNKRAATTLVETGDVTVGEMRRRINMCRGVRRQSKVNPTIPLDAALNIFEAALRDRDNSEKIVPFTTDPYSRRGAMLHTRDFLLARNIVRECY